MSRYVLNLINYDILYIIDLPTKVTDYDYDINKPDRRFISTLLHELRFYDKFNKVEIANLKFSSDVCYNIRYSLSKITEQINDSISRPLVLTVKDVYLNHMYTPSILSLFKNKDGSIQLSLLNNINNATLSFMDYEILKIIKLLKQEI